MDKNAQAKADLEARRYAATSPQHVECFRDDALGCLVLMFQNTDRTVTMAGFSGRRYKPDWQYLFNSLGEADKFRREWYDNVVDAAERKAQARTSKAAKLAIPQTNFAVGDIVVTLDVAQKPTYYEVTRLVGKRSVELRQVEAIKTKTWSWWDAWDIDCVPRKGHYIGDERITKHVNEHGQIKFGAKVVASKKEATVVNGVETFQPDTYVRNTSRTNMN
jgi:hypothetical protein